MLNKEWGTVRFSHVDLIYFCYVILIVLGCIQKQLAIKEEQLQLVPKMNDRYEYYCKILNHNLNIYLIA